MWVTLYVAFYDSILPHTGVCIYTVLCFHALAQPWDGTWSCKLPFPHYLYCKSNLSVQQSLISVLVKKEETLWFWLYTLIKCPANGPDSHSKSNTSDISSCSRAPSHGTISYMTRIQRHKTVLSENIEPTENHHKHRANRPTLSTTFLLFEYQWRNHKSWSVCCSGRFLSSFRLKSFTFGLKNSTWKVLQGHGNRKTISCLVPVHPLCEVLWILDRNMDM